MATVKENKLLTGGLSNPSKMPGKAWNTPASECKVGTRMRAVEGSICEDCYAFERGRYNFPNVKNALQRRLDLYRENPGRWATAMYELIKKQSPDWFRWFDSGDLEDVEQLMHIVQIAKSLPETKFWLPTREYATVREYLKEFSVFPANLSVRMSAMMKGEPCSFTSAETTTSTVAYAEGFDCPASTQGNECRECRACWDKAVPNINYKKH